MEHVASEAISHGSPGSYLPSNFSEDSADTPIQYTSFDMEVSEAFEETQRTTSSRSPDIEKTDVVHLHAPTPARRNPSNFEEDTPLVSNRSFLSQMRGIHRPASPSGTFPVESPKRPSREARISAESAGECSIEENSARLPQHFLVDPDSSILQYRIAYRGIVSLLATPCMDGLRNGSYLSYGDIFESSWCSETAGTYIDSAVQLKPRFDADSPQEQLSQAGPPTMPSLQQSCISEINNRHSIIRVDRVLTRGYSIDPRSEPVHEDEPTNLAEGKFAGFLVSHIADQCIAEKLDSPPEIEERLFLFKISSSSPLPMFSGPSFDAPKMKAVALPGMTVEASLRIRVKMGTNNEENGVSFLRLSHRRGWLADRRQGSAVPMIAEVPIDMPLISNCDDSMLSCASTMTSFTASSRARSKHRPPRKRADATIEAPAKNIPRSSCEINTSGTPEKNSSLHESSQCSRRLPSPISNLSLLSDESSIDHNSSELRHPQSPDVSHSTSWSIGTSASKSTSHLFLMRVTSPRGLKILDAPQFQVNNLIRGNTYTSGTVSSSHMISQMEAGPPKKHHSIFQTMSGRLTTTGPSSRTGNPAIFDSGSKTRMLPRGVLFEASRRIENSGAFSDGEGLIKLSDNSGWAIVPTESDLDDQYRIYQGKSLVKERRAFEEVGNAIVHDTIPLNEENKSSVWLRVELRSGLPVSCPPPSGNMNDGDTSPTSSRDSSSVSGSHAGSHIIFGHESDVASSVGSTFLDSVFRSPQKRLESEGSNSAVPKSLHYGDIVSSLMSDSVSCGTCVEVQKWIDTNGSSSENQDYARLLGGQGWLPMHSGGKVASVVIPKPEFRFGSFWFRVKSSRGVKARQGPSRRAPSIRSEDGAHVMRFECGEFLRASEIVTIISSDGQSTESFAKLYRNRHVQLYRGHEPFRPLLSLTVLAEWVPIFTSPEQFLEECTSAPRIERHKQGWRYNVVPANGVAVRKGPSFASETTGVILTGGDSVIANERVTPGGESIVWLRLRDGQWVHDTDDEGNQVMIAHSLFRHSIPRPETEGRTTNDLLDQKEVAYKKIVSRLFQGGNEMSRTDLKDAPRFPGR